MQSAQIGYPAGSGQWATSGGCSSRATLRFSRYFWMAYPNLSSQFQLAPAAPHSASPICGATTSRRPRVRVAKRPLRPAQPVTGASSSLEKLDALRLSLLYRNNGTLRARNASSVATLTRVVLGLACAACRVPNTKCADSRSECDTRLKAYHIEVLAIKSAR